MSTSTIPLPTARPATVDDLAKVDGKADLINGKIVHQMATGYQPNRAGFRIARSLDDHAELTGRGVAYTHNMGFGIPKLPSGRESFSPDASFYLGLVPRNPMGFVQEHNFAVEVRSESDYGDAAEKAMAAKRSDYFLAGTSVIWDVDLLSKCVRKYLAESQEKPIVFSQGEQAEAEPAVPGWRLPVDRLLS